MAKADEPEFRSARHDHPGGAPQGQHRHRRRRPGDAGQYRHEVERAQGAPPANGKVVAAGGTADAFTLFERSRSWGFGSRARRQAGQGRRADRYLRRLGALLLVGDPESLSDFRQRRVIEPARAGGDRVGGLCAGRALACCRARSWAREIVERALNIAADIYIYTNRNLVIEELSA
jgi:ATP-dependent protease HslVU (ClpYQ) peptidase subunit